MTIFLLLDLHPEFHDLRRLLGRLLMRMHEGRRDELDLLARQLEIRVREAPGVANIEGSERRAHHVRFCG